MADNSTAIADIRAILRQGATTVTIDGQTIVYDFVALRRELRELMADDTADTGRRPVATRITLAGF
jgi:hypothetical protein